MTSNVETLYDQVVRTTYVYLGPAADRFVSRQISNHLKKRPDQLKTRDLPELIDWIKLAMSFLTEDEKLVDDYVARLQLLSGKSPKRGTLGSDVASKADSHVIQAY